MWVYFDDHVSQNELHYRYLFPCISWTRMRVKLHLCRDVPAESLHFIHFATPFLSRVDHTPLSSHPCVLLFAFHFPALSCVRSSMQMNVSTFRMPSIICVVLFLCSWSYECQHLQPVIEQTLAQLLVEHDVRRIICSQCYVLMFRFWFHIFASYFVPCHENAYLFPSTQSLRHSCHNPIGFFSFGDVSMAAPCIFVFVSE